MGKSLLQIPVETNLRAQAAKAAAEMGFSSLQEPVRVFLKQLADRSVKVKFEPVVKLSAKNERRYAKMTEDFKRGRRVKTFDTVKDLMRDLAS